jgi:hypothetical protein
MAALQFFLSPASLEKYISINLPTIVEQTIDGWKLFYRYFIKTHSLVNGRRKVSSAKIEFFGDEEVSRIADFRSVCVPIHAPSCLLVRVHYSRIVF